MGDAKIPDFSPLFVSRDCTTPQSLRIVAEMYTYIFLLFLLPVLHVNAGEENDCKNMIVNCFCKKGNEMIHQTLEMRPTVSRDSETGNVSCSGYPDPHEACANHNCTVSNSSESSDKSGMSSNLNPEIFTIKKGEFSDGYRRYARNTLPCHVPPLKNAEIKCYKWPNWMNCDVKCIYNHAMETPNGTVKFTNINCRKTQNIWKPHGFFECQPYVNCKVRLVKPGKLRCTHPVDAPAYCDISCHDYDDYEAVKHQRYECKDDTFEKTLPHCTVLNENVRTIAEPKN